MFAVVNLQTGRVITPDNFYDTSTVYFGVEGQKFFPDSQSGVFSASEKTVNRL